MNVSRILAPAASLAFAPVVALAQAEAPPVAFFAAQTAGLAFLVILAAMVLVFFNQREKRRQELLARFIDKGQEIPLALLPQQGRSRQRDLSRGVWLLAWGIGIGMALYISTGDWSGASWALILLCLSAASFVNAVLFSTSRAKATEGLRE